MQRLVLSLFTLFFCMAPGFIQEAPDFPRPPTNTGVYYLAGKQWKPIKPLLHSGLKVRGQGWWPITSLKNVLVYRGKTSPYLTSNQPTFCVVGPSKFVERNAVVVQTKVKGKNRELQISKGGDLFHDAEIGHREKDVFQLRVLENRDTLILLRPDGELPRGEFVLSLDGQPVSTPIYDFTVSP